MEYYDKEFCLEVWGDIACFTRPELKVERVSYDVITPSAARAIFEAIFWKPAIRWQVTKIEVLNPIKWISIRRNEVGAVASRTMESIYIEEKRQQKNSLMLRDVKYRIYAKLIFIPLRDRVNDKKHRMQQLDLFNDTAIVQPNDENPGKYNAMFERRASKGQCFNQPYLGTRECVASFRLVNQDSETLTPPIAEDKDLGIMLYDMDFAGNADKPEAMFFRAKMENGVIIVPPLNSKEVLR
ncbi:MAG: type I-C CRISPR-associated protein Cas5 [Paludibacteraceae bacterium]|nr:type I-C CRISPR-associated protein Cas5 [Paludibacteraceae bacterium]